MDTGDRVGVRVGTEETPLGYWGGTGEICGWAGSKSNLGKAAGAEVAVERRHANLHAAVARSTFSSKMPLSQAAYIARMFGPLLEVAMWKNCKPL